jgi:hypothetical protein
MLAPAATLVQQEGPNSPLAGFKCSTDRTTVVSVAVWGNEMTGQDGSTWIQYGITLSRSYKGQDGKWYPSSSDRAHVIPVLLFLLNRAHDWIVLQRLEDSTIPF